MTLPLLLKQTSSIYGKCAKALAAKRPASGFSEDDYERMIGIGIASDWLHVAADLKALAYHTSKRGHNDRAAGLTELTRFTFMWTATNGLFARPSILHTFDPGFNKDSEIDKFRLLVTQSSMLPSTIAARTDVLHKILSEPTNVKQPLPQLPDIAAPTALQVIYYKYIPPSERRRPISRAILNASRTGIYTNLDLATLIYAARNWNIHGVFLSTVFRGTQARFLLYINTINLSLAEILYGAGSTLLTKL